MQHTAPGTMRLNAHLARVAFVALLLACARLPFAAANVVVTDGSTQTLAKDGTIAGTVSLAANYACWFTGTAAITTPIVTSDCKVAGTETAFGTDPAAVCGEAGEAWSATWDAVASTHISIIECSGVTGGGNGVGTGVGTAVAIALTETPIVVTDGSIQTLAKDGTIAGTVSLAANYACWFTGTAAIITPIATSDCKVAGTETAFGFSAQAVCGAAGAPTSTMWSAAWDVVTHTHISIIECSGVGTSVGAAVALTLTQTVFSVDGGASLTPAKGAAITGALSGVGNYPCWFASITHTSRTSDSSEFPPGLWGRWTARSWESTFVKQWDDVSGNGRHAIDAMGAPTRRTERGIDFIEGGTADGIRFPVGSIPTSFTVFVVARYTPGTSSKNRMFEDVTKNWLHGFHNGNAGVCHYEGWKTLDTDASNGDAWLTIGGRNGGMQVTTTSAGVGLLKQKYTGYYVFHTPSGTATVTTSLDVSDSGDYYSYTFSGRILPAKTGAYCFRVTVDDRCEVFVGGTRVLMGVYSVNAGVAEGCINLLQNTDVSIVVYYGEITNAAVLTFEWKKPEGVAWLATLDDEFHPADKAGVILVDGVNRATAPGGTSGGQLTINNGWNRVNNPAQLTEWQVAEVVVFNRALTDSEMVAVDTLMRTTTEKHTAIAGTDCLVAGTASTFGSAPTAVCAAVANDGTWTSRWDEVANGHISMIECSAAGVGVSAAVPVDVTYVGALIIGSRTPSLKKDASIGGTVSDAANYICWTTGTADVPVSAATCSAEGSDVAFGSESSVVCGAATGVTTFSLQWDVVTQVSLSLIECSAAGSPVGDAVAVLVSELTSQRCSPLLDVKLNETLDEINFNSSGPIKFSMPWYVVSFFFCFNLFQLTH